MLPVSTSNYIADELMACASAAGASALSSAILGLSVGATGGAIFGLSSYILGGPIRWICAEIFNLNHPSASEAAKTIGYAIRFFATLGVNMWGLSITGFPITFTTAIVLTIASYIIPTILVAIVRSACNCCLVGNHSQKY